MLQPPLCETLLHFLMVCSVCVYMDHITNGFNCFLSSLKLCLTLRRLDLQQPHTDFLHFLVSANKRPPVYPSEMPACALAALLVVHCTGSSSLAWYNGEALIVFKQLNVKQTDFYNICIINKIYYITNKIYILFLPDKSGSWCDLLLL